jgi:hypothetical protein
MKKFKSDRRALKRGHLIVSFRRMILGWDSSPITGEIFPRFGQVPILLRRTTRGRLVAYK